jgi:hypothetical protein
MIRANMKAFGVKIGAMTHVRQPTTPDNQPVIRMNQDTLYSGTVLDLSKPVKLTLPEADGRYMSMHVVNNHRQRRWLGMRHLEGALLRCRDD